MKRRIFNAIAVVSAVLCVGAAAFWFWAGRYRAGFSICFRHSEYSVMAVQRSLVLWRGATDLPLVTGIFKQSGNLKSFPHSPEETSQVGDVKDPPQQWMRQVGELWVHGEISTVPSRSGGSPYTLRSVELVVPYWMLATVSALLPALAWLGYRRERMRVRRLRNGQCFKCGYDLRATPDRCPECGAVPAQIRIPKPEIRNNDE